MTEPTLQPPPVCPLRDHAAWGPLDQATVLASGSDAVRFVDNFVTASVSSVAVGSGTEAYVTDARGHVIALVTILRTEAGLEIIAVAGLGERLRDHLEHFHIREAVELVDTTDAMSALVVAGPEAVRILAALIAPTATLPTADLDHALFTIAGHAVRVVRITGQEADGFQIRGEPSAIDAVAQSLPAAGVPRASNDDLEAARINAGYPAAIDILEKTLPQELGRDTRAISFTKGCYLGQETVARLDALGHVNRRLTILAIESDRLPACPSPIHQGDDIVGTLTSRCLDLARGMAIGLGIVHTKAIASPLLTIGNIPARVIAVPPARMKSP